MIVANPHTKNKNLPLGMESSDSVCLNILTSHVQQIFFYFYFNKIYENRCNITIVDIGLNLKFKHKNEGNY